MSCGEEKGGGSRREPPREPPRTLQGLLELAVTAGEPGGGGRGPLGPEQQQWLREALSAALGGGGGSGGPLERCLRDLEGPDPPEESLELLAELCENLDHATEFCARGGLRPTISLLSHPRGGLRAGAARLLGACAQNLPEAQGGALDLGALPALLGALGGDPDPRVPPAALFAISCLVRGQPRGRGQLERLGGLEVLGGALGSPPLRARGAFLLQSLLGEHPPLREVLVAQGWVPRLVGLLRTEHGPAHEHIMGALWGLAQSPRGVQECRAPPLRLEELLRERGGRLRGHQENQEELEFCDRLLRLCFPQTPPQENPPQEPPPTSATTQETPTPAPHLALQAPPPAPHHR